MHVQILLNSWLAAFNLNLEVWLSIFIGILASLLIAYIIYRLQKKETTIHKQEHDAKLNEIRELHLQDSEKIRVLYELILQSQKGSLGEAESTVLEQQIEAAADNITDSDSDHAQALKAIADKDKDKADDLLDKIAQREHDLAEVYHLRAINEYRHGNYQEALKWCRKILELEPDNFEALADLIQNLNKTDQHNEARELALAKLNELEQEAEPDNEKAFSLLSRIISSIDTSVEPEQVGPYIFKAMELAQRVYGEQSHQVASIHKELGLYYQAKQQYQESEEALLKALASKDLSSDKAKSNHNWTLNALGILYNELGRYQEALDCFQQCYDSTAAVLGTDHPTIIYSLLGLGTINCYLGNMTEAERCFRQAREVGINRLGKKHKLAQSSTYNLTTILVNQGQSD